MNARLAIRALQQQTATHKVPQRTFLNWLLNWGEAKPSFKGDPVLNYNAMPSFEELDENNDGFLSRTELIRGLVRSGFHHITPQEASVLFDTLDTNGDGKLSPQEFYHHAMHYQVNKATAHFSFESGLTQWLEDPKVYETSTEFMAALDRVWAANAAPALIVDAQPPHQVIHTNTAWGELTGYGNDDVFEGLQLQDLHGAETDKHVLDTMMEGVKAGRGSEANLVSYTKAGDTFRNHFKIEPIHSNCGSVTHFVVTMQQIQASTA